MKTLIVVMTVLATTLCFAQKPTNHSNQDSGHERVCDNLLPDKVIPLGTRFRVIEPISIRNHQTDTDRGRTEGTIIDSSEDYGFSLEALGGAAPETLFFNRLSHFEVIENLSDGSAAGLVLRSVGSHRTYRLRCYQRQAEVPCTPSSMEQMMTLGEKRLFEPVYIDENIQWSAGFRTCTDYPINKANLIVPDDLPNSNYSDSPVSI